MIFDKKLLALAAALFTTPAMAETDMPFALGWKFEGPSAPYFHALDAGYFADAGLTVTISEGAGSLEAIPKVTTSHFPGAYLCWLG